MMDSILGQRILGLIATGLTGGVTVLVWERALAGSGFNRWGACVAPALFVFGLALLLFPIDIQAHRKRWGTSRPEHFREFPLSWRLLSVLALVAGVGNLLALLKFSR